MIGARLVRESFRAMGTECTAAVTATRGDDARAHRSLDAARREIARCEQVLSRFREGSDLSHVNAAGGAWTQVDDRLVEALRIALRIREETEGRFDPTILPALLAAGYDRSFEQLTGRPPESADGWRPSAFVEIEPVNGRVRVERGAAIDLGGIGKGFAATRALWAMHEAWLELPGGLVDLGGDIAVWGATPEGGPWCLAVADPREPDSTIATVALEQGGAATSGPDRRRFGPGLHAHHLIDPATGRPAAAGPLAVTVVGPDAAEAEGYATALAVAPVEDAPACLAARPTLSALVVPPGRAPFAVGALPLVDSDSLEVLP
jgi:thiamine biosynthesis lipoprotein